MRRGTRLAGAILIALCMGLGGAASQESPQEQPTPTEEQIQETEDDQTVTESPEAAPPETNTSVTEFEATNGDQDRQDRIESEEWPKIAVQYVSVAFRVLVRYWHEIALSLFTGLLALFTYRLYSATSGLREAARDQHEAMMESVAAANRAADESAKANDLTRGIFLAAERPWVHLESAIITKSPNLRKGRIGTSVQFIVRNSGKTPARNVFVAAEAILPETGIDVGAAQSRLIQRAVSRLPLFDNLLEPTGRMPMPGYGISVDVVEAMASIGDKGMCHVGIIGVIDYSFTFEAGRHQTPFYLVALMLPDLTERADGPVEGAFTKLIAAPSPIPPN